MNYIWGTGTHVGRIREMNEDSVFPAESGRSGGPALVFVADGMGGAVAGEVASGLATEAASDAPPTDPISPEDRVQAGNRAVIEATREDPSLAGMGTTMTLALFSEDGTASFAHVGDSRAYLFRNNELRMLTNDHTLVNELIELGRITPEDAKTHPHRHLITRVLGVGPIAVDTFDLDLMDGDRLLFCSDGLTDMVTDVSIANMLAAGQGVEPTAWALIEQANAAGGLDNTTVVVVDVGA